MDPAALQIIDANANRAREGLRVLEEYARFALNDATLSARIKRLRHDLTAVVTAIGADAMLAERDTPNDVGTTISTPAELQRLDGESVARSSASRVAEALRCIEEYGKLVDPKLAVRVEALRYELYAVQQIVFLAGPRRLRLRVARVHVLVTQALCRGDWWHIMEAALEGGATVIQLREKGLPDRALIERARAARELTRRFDSLLIVNDRPDVARLADADGVHLGQSDMSVADARKVIGHGRLVGLSTHDRAEIDAALAAQPDYIGVGPMFASATKPGVPVRGPDLLALALERCASGGDTSVVAIGGITAANVHALVAHARGPFAVAVSSAIIGAAEPRLATRAMIEALDG